MTDLYSALNYSAATGVTAARVVGLVWHWGQWEQSGAAAVASEWRWVIGQWC